MLCLAVLGLALAAIPVRAQHVLVPMDDEQGNHLKAYGLMFSALKDGLRGEWLLNYRGGSFLLPDVQSLRRRAAIDGVTLLGVDNATLAGVRAEIASANMDAVPLEKAPRIAVYTPPRRTSVGRRCDARPTVRGNRIHHHLGCRSRARRPR